MFRILQNLPESLSLSRISFRRGVVRKGDTERQERGRIWVGKESERGRRGVGEG